MDKTISKKLCLFQHIARLLMGGVMLLAGIGHLTFARVEFQAQVPQWIPVDVDQVVILSGFVEILLAILILTVGHRKTWVPTLIGLFFIAVFPGNWEQYIYHRDAFGLNTDTLRIARLFFQPILIFWALWSMDALIKK
ncbi:hypothetical protein LZQ00_09930 [Sphingobacterium sp. SRCM116780]|uniref:DoxX family protein n=1 Tax=Sphingobacterium sp. SRCM116780 TaxID=2907623 RepID=UPI001F354802|nr:hypothetical protein [Sphingobacterium sp. SRCM116780]UIR54592.1 hypothetical protein LZQ00_09930 [Sphingobacterium sp. SRCM116780]